MGFSATMRVVGRSYPSQTFGLPLAPPDRPSFDSPARRLHSAVGFRGDLSLTLSTLYTVYVRRRALTLFGRRSGEGKVLANIAPVLPHADIISIAQYILQTMLYSHVMASMMMMQFRHCCTMVHAIDSKHR